MQGYSSLPRGMSERGGAHQHPDERYGGRGEVVGRRARDAGERTGDYHAQAHQPVQSWPSSSTSSYGSRSEPYGLSGVVPVGGPSHAGRPNVGSCYPSTSGAVAAPPQSSLTSALFAPPYPHHQPSKHTHDINGHPPSFQHRSLGSSSAMSSSPAAYPVSEHAASSITAREYAREAESTEPSSSYVHSQPTASPPFPSHLASASAVGDPETAYERPRTLSGPSEIEADGPSSYGGQTSAGLREQQPYPSRSSQPPSRGEHTRVEQGSRWSEPEGTRSQHEHNLWRDPHGPAPPHQLDDERHLARQHPSAYYDTHPPTEQAYPLNPVSDYSASTASHHPSEPSSYRPLYPYQPSSMASSSAPTAVYPAMALYPQPTQPPPPSWSHAAQYGQHDLASDPYHPYDAPHPDSVHPQTISPTTFAQHAHPSTTGSTDQSLYASYHSSYSGEEGHSQGSGYDDELAYGSESSPNGHWSAHDQGGAVGWVATAGVETDGRGAGTRRRAFVQDGSGRMGYAGLGESGRGATRTGEVVKMGGKANKGARGKGANGGLDGRGKGDENWIGGQKTRRQVKNACQTCQKLHKPCDEARPCGRCVKRGPKFADQCQDSDRKPKKGHPRGRNRTGVSTNERAVDESASEPARIRHGLVEPEMKPPSISMGLRERVGDRVPPALPPLDGMSQSRKASEDSSYASSVQHSRSSTSSASSSTFPFTGVPYDHYRRTSGLAHQIDPARIVEDDGVGGEEDEFEIRGWHAEEKGSVPMERRDQPYACTGHRPQSPFPLQPPIGHPQMPPYPVHPHSAPLPAYPSARYSSSFHPPADPPPEHPHYPPPHHQPSWFGPTSASAFQLQHAPPPPRNASGGRHQPPPALFNLPTRRQTLAEEGNMDPPPSPRGDRPTPDRYKRSPLHSPHSRNDGDDELDPARTMEDDVSSTTVVEVTSA